MVDMKCITKVNVGHKCITKLYCFFNECLAHNNKCLVSKIGIAASSITILYHKNVINKCLVMVAFSCLEKAVVNILLNRVKRKIKV